MGAAQPFDGRIRATGVVQRLGGREILHGVDLDVGPGVHGLLGPNGAGKTTLLRILATVARPVAGKVLLAGHNIQASSERMAARRSLGYLPQDFVFYPRFTALETVEYVAWLRGLSPTSIRASAETALDNVGLSSAAGLRMRKLSGGMVRRVGIAQAIVSTPSILLLDEPTTGLDPAQRIEFRQLVRTLGERSAVLLSTHLIDDVGAACDRVAVIDGGKLRFTGTVREFEGHEQPDMPGDSVLERAYAAVLQERA